MIEPSNQQLSISRQCTILDVNRSSYYYRPKPMKQEDLSLSAQGSDHQSAQSGLGCRYYLYSNGPRIHVPRGYAWTGTAVKSYPGGSQTLWNRPFVWMLLKRHWLVLVHLEYSIPIKGLSLPAMPLPRFSKTTMWPSAWMVGGVARTTSLSSGSGGPSNTNTCTCIHSIPARRCGDASPNGFSITILKGDIRLLTIEPRMRFITVCLIRLPRQPDAFFSFQKLLACSLSDSSGCPGCRVHRPWVSRFEEAHKGTKQISGN